MKSPQQRLVLLAKRSTGFEMFLKEALKWPRRYGFPGSGSMIDWKGFYNSVMGDL